MHNFDQDKPTQAQQFILHGETFTLRRSVQPEKLAAFEDAEEMNIKASEKLAMVDAAMLECLTESDHGKWRMIRADESEDAVDLITLVEVVKWSIGAVTGRHPIQPDSSLGSLSDPGMSSTDASPSPQGLMSVPST